MLSPEAPRIIHDGELADIGRLFAEFGLAFAEAPARVADVEAYYRASLVIASPEFLLERLEDPPQTHTARIVLMTDQGRTVRSRLTRSGVSWIVRRPVHPTALRLFILHCLYEGYDKRGNQRVSVGSEVQIRAGWRPRKALLAEMSQHDCRLVTHHPFEMDQSVSLELSRNVTGQRVLSLTGRVVRIGETSQPGGPRDVCLSLDRPRAQDAHLLDEVLEMYAWGPAIFDGDEGEGVIDGVEGAAVAEGTTGANRRATLRHSFERRVIALGAEAARVLLGRDISRDGMRVDSSSWLALGDQLQIALHTPGEKAPLVLRALVKRDDGERGLLLGFVEVTPEAEARLGDMITPLPELSEGPETGEDEASDLIVSEILEHSAAAG